MGGTNHSPTIHPSLIHNAQGYNFQLVAPQPGGGVLTISESSQPPERPVAAAVRTLSSDWTLLVAPAAGWVPSWRDPLLAMVIVICVAIGLMLTGLLVNRRQQKWLLAELRVRLPLPPPLLLLLLLPTVLACTACLCLLECYELLSFLPLSLSSPELPLPPPLPFFAPTQHTTHDPTTTTQTTRARDSRPTALSPTRSSAWTCCSRASTT